jgi:putative membrane protein
MYFLKLIAPAAAMAVALSAQSHTPATAGGDRSGSAQKSGNLTSTDRAFLMTAAQDGKMEVEISQMAANRASKKEVKNYAQRMVTDHTRANQELMSLARTKGLDLKDEPSYGERRKNMIEPMSRMSGADFDREFMKQQVEHHRTDVASFEKHSKAADDPDVRAWAQKTLPVLREHLKMAESVHQSVGGRTGTGMRE